jgi:hypothetical protein
VLFVFLLLIFYSLVILDSRVVVEDFDSDTEGVLFVIRMFGSPGGGDDEDALNETLYISFFTPAMSFWLVNALFGYCIALLSVLESLF